MITICVSLKKQDLTSFSLSTTSDFDLSKQKSKDLPYIKAHQNVLKAKKNILKIIYFLNENRILKDESYQSHHTHR